MTARRHTRNTLLQLLLAVSLGACMEESSAPGPPPRSPASVPPVPQAPAESGCSAGELRQEPVKVLRGKATFYANSLRGNRTANGDRYDPRLLTAAHRSLPFGTRVRVTRTDLPTSPVVCVVINDRGPFGRKSYILDLSRRGAEQMQMLRKGVVPVQIDVLTIGKR